MSLESILQTYFVGSLVLMAFALLFSMAFFGVWLAGLLHCLKYKNDGDRLVWVLVTLFGGPVGGLLYFAMGRVRLPVVREPPVVGRGVGVAGRIAAEANHGSIDHAAIHDPQKRAASIREALQREADARRMK